jgi:hypothetical protein
MNIKEKLGAVVLGGALVLGGAAGAYALSGVASAQSTGTSSSSSSSTQNGTAQYGTTPQPPAQNGGPNGGAPAGPHVANGITETLLTGTDAEKATAAATKAVPGATIDRVETDAEGARYEAHMTKSDGSRVTVKMDASFNVSGVEDGMR